MQIDRTDLSILRAIEWGGIISHNTALRKLKLDDAEISRRLKRMRDEKMIRSFQASVFVPPLLGKKWVWGCALIQTRKPEEAAKAIRVRIPFVTELVFNASVPAAIGPNLSVLFYATNFNEVKRFLNEIPDIDYVEVYQIARYDYPLAQPFSSDEGKLLKAIVDHPDALLAELAKVVRKPEDWTQAKLDRLVWDPENPAGVILVLPEINWHCVENFAHVHFLLESSVSPASVIEELSKAGLTPVLDAQLFRNKYLQLETDVWGFGDLLARKQALDRVAGIYLAGLLIAENNSVVSDWVPKLLGADR
jgi:DNA-binding Lrp family transcriptional regulator